MDTFSLEIDADPSLVPTARMFAATVARRYGVEEDAVLDVKIAVSEACTNAVQAHMEREVEGPITLRVTETGPDLVYEVADAGEGIGHVPEEPPEVFRKAIEDAEHRQGMGLALIRSIFPQAEFEATDAGTTVRFQLAR